MLEDCDQILKAKSPSDLFGVQEKRSKIIYRRLARAVHPDLYPEPHKAKAQQAFVRLTELWDIHLKKTSPASDTTSKNVIKTKRHEYTLGDKIGDFGIYAKYEATYDAGHKRCQLLITKSPKDSDLAQANATTLKTMNEKVPADFTFFYPEFVESFRYRMDDNTDHFIVVQQRVEDFTPLTKVLEVYPEGISGRDVAWIFKRMLVAIGNAHDTGIVHGAPTMDAFLIHPDYHGLILSDWQYSVEIGTPLKAIPPKYKDLYPKYVFNKEDVSHSLDVFIIAKTAQSLLRDDAPRQFSAFFKACMMDRTMEPKYLLKEFDDLLKRLYGEPKFHPFTLNP